MANLHGKSYSTAFKFDIVLETLNTTTDDAEITRKHGIHPVTLSNWNTHFLDHGAEVFTRKHAEEGPHTTDYPAGTVVGPELNGVGLESVTWRPGLVCPLEATAQCRGGPHPSRHGLSQLSVATPATLCRSRRSFL